jgi:S1-C subfamily serine protease
MTTRAPAPRHRRRLAVAFRRRLAVAFALVMCLALAGLVALSGMAFNTAATGPDRHPLPIVLTADDGGVVDITTRLGYQGGAAAGTGIVISPGGEVLTNNHVIKGASQITVTVPGGPGYEARVVGTDPKRDVALLEMAGAQGLASAALGDSSTVAVGDRVKAIGNAGGVGGTPAVAEGKVTALDQSITTTDENGVDSEHLHGLIQTDARVEPGDSGGPLVNASGQVIGVDTAAAVDKPGDQRAPEGFAIPINSAMAIVRAIEAGSGSAEIHVEPVPPLGVEILDGAFPAHGDLLPASLAEAGVRR